MRRPLISDQWSREYHNETIREFKEGIFPTTLTFCGTLEELYRMISRDWNNETRKKYDRDYNAVILPNIENHNSKTISEYSKEDCEHILKLINDRGYLSGGELKKYSESQLNHFKYLVYLVFKYASQVGYCRDFLWGSKFEVNDERNDLAIKSKTKIKKSLSVIQEKKLFSQLMESPCEDGKLIALLLMFSMGLRDGEACGLDFGDIYELPYYPGTYVAIIKQTTIPHTSILQSSGKTWNSGRRIPIPTRVKNFLLERKAAIEDIIMRNHLDLDVDRIPVAGEGFLFNDNLNLGKRLKAQLVTDEANNIFRLVGISSEQLGSLEIEMEEEYSRLEVTERCVTAYLLRRNFATHLKILGLDYPDIQYLLGHCIEDPYINRPDYTDMKLWKLSKKMSKRPLVNYVEDDTVSLKKNSEEEFSGRQTVKILLGKKTKIRISALEKKDALVVRDVSASDNILIFYEEYKAYEPHRKIDIVQKYQDDYK